LAGYSEDRLKAMAEQHISNGGILIVNARPKKDALVVAFESKSR
jgi:hypothetical protein